MLHQFIQNISDRIQAAFDRGDDFYRIEDYDPDAPDHAHVWFDTRDGEWHSDRVDSKH